MTRTFKEEEPDSDGFRPRRIADQAAIGDARGTQSHSNSGRSYFCLTFKTRERCVPSLSVLNTGRRMLPSVSPSPLFRFGIELCCLRGSTPLLRIMLFDQLGQSLCLSIHSVGKIVDAVG